MTNTFNINMQLCSGQFLVVGLLKIFEDVCVYFKSSISASKSCIFKFF